MIDIQIETIFLLAELPDHAPHRNGRKMHRATGFRWASRGCRAANGEQIRLETLKTPTGLITSVEALQRFYERLSTGDGEVITRTSVQRRRAHEQAERELDAAGIG